MKIIKNSKTISAKAYNGVHLLLGLHTRKNVPRGLKLIQDASDGNHPLALHAQAYLNIRNKDNPNIKLAKQLIKKLQLLVMKIIQETFLENVFKISQSLSRKFNLMKTASIQNLRHYYLSTGILRFLNSYILSDNKSYLLRLFK